MTDKTPFRLLTGGAAKTLASLPARSVDCLVTSPPYFGLRDYDDPDQIGFGCTLPEYLAGLAEVFQEALRVVSPTGTLWLNIGDTYQSTGGTVGVGPNASVGSTKREGAKPRIRVKTHLPSKNLIGVPWRTAFLLQDMGWVLRSEIIWSKSNAMPESVQDRPSRSFEQVFFFSRSPRYAYDAQSLREPRADGKGDRAGRNIWSIPVRPYPGAHFATYPVELPRRCISAGCRPGGHVLDPFSGSGSTGEAAVTLGRRYTGIDLNESYHDLARSRIMAAGGQDYSPGKDL